MEEGATARGGGLGLREGGLVLREEARARGGG